MDNIASRLQGLSPQQKSLLLSRLTALRGVTPADVSGGLSPLDHPNSGEEGNGEVPLLPAQRLLLRQLETYGADPNRYPITSLVQATRPVSAELVESAFGSLILRHEALRMRFIRAEHGHGWRQQLGSPPVELVRVVDLADVPTANRPTVIAGVLDAAQQSLDLASGRLICLTVLRLARGEGPLLFLAVHHLAADAYSIGIIWRDFWTAYCQLEQGEPIRLPRIATSFRAWVRRLQEYAASPEFENDARYWRDMPWHTAPSTGNSDLPRTTPGQPASLLTILTREETALALNALPVATQLPEAVLAGLVDALRRLTGHTAQRIAVVRHGRAPLWDGIDLSETVGWLTVHPILVLDLAHADGPASAVEAITKQLHQMPKEGITWEWLAFSAEHRNELLRVVPSPALAFDYLGGGEIFPTPDSLRPAPEAVDAAASIPNVWIARVLMVAAQLRDGQLRVKFLYDQRTYPEQTVRQLANSMAAFLSSLGSRNDASGASDV